MEHSVDLSAKTFVQAVAPTESSARKILKKTKKTPQVTSNDDSGAHLTDFSFDDDDDDDEENEGDDGEEEEALEVEVDAADSVGKALLLVKQVCLTWLLSSSQTFTLYTTHSDSCFSSGSGIF